MKLVKTQLHTQLKQTDLINQLHISIESPKGAFNDTVFQHFVFYVQYIWLFMLPFRMILFHNIFLFIFCMNLQYFSPLTIFCNKMFALLSSSIIKDLQMTIKMEIIAFIQKTEKTYNFCGIAYVVYYTCFQHEAFNEVIYVIIVGTPTSFMKGGLSF